MPVHQDERDGVVVLTLDHGPVHALDLDLCRELGDACLRIADRAAGPGAPVRAVVLTGAGGTFSAGVDLRAVLAGGPSYLERFLPALDEAFRHLLALPVHLVAAVNGHAVGGGCVLLCCADAVVATTGRAAVGLPELGIGLPFPLAALEAVRSALGDAAVLAPETSAVATFDDAPWAGLPAARAAPDDVVDAAVALARGRVAAAGPAAVARTKAQLHRSRLGRIDAHAAADRALALPLWREQLDSGALAAVLGGGPTR